MEPWLHQPMARREVGPATCTAEELDGWVVAAQAGDREAFVRVMMACHRELQTFLCARSVSVAMVDEVVQSTFVTAFTRLSSYRPGGTFLPWLKGIGRNHLHEALRQRARYVQMEAGDLEAMLARRYAEAEEPADPPAMDRRRIERCLERLPPLVRALITRRHVQGVAVKELARSLSRTVNWVAVNLHRARLILRDCLTREAP